MNDQEVRRIWDTTLGQLQLQVTRPNYETWLKDTVGLSLADDNFVIGTCSDFATECLSSRMSPLIAKTVSSIIGKPTAVSFRLMPRSGNGQQASKATLFKDADPAKQAVISSPSPKPNLNERFTFENLIVSDFNRLAVTSALAAADRAGQVYNPLFIYGAVGLGKTHLLHSIGHRFHQHSLRLIYVTAEQFTNEFVNAIAQGRIDDFRRKYRSPQSLLIDDVQFLAGKERTQEEFFHTFNELHASSCQIVITSDRLPQAIGPLETRLRSRFRWGLIADIQAPDLETRLAILRRKALEQGIDLDPAVARLLAERIPDNIRDLEGSLNRVIAMARLESNMPKRQDTIHHPAGSPSQLKSTSRVITSLISANHALSALTSHAPASPATPDNVIRTVCSYFNISQQAVCSSSRTQPVTMARHVAMFLLREDADKSLKEIGYILGSRDHSTIIHGCKKISTLLKSDPQLRLNISEIRSRLLTA